MSRSLRLLHIGGRRPHRVETPLPGRLRFELVTEHRDDLATILTMEQGKPFGEAIREIDYSATYFRWCAATSLVSSSVDTYSLVIQPAAAPLNVTGIASAEHSNADIRTQTVADGQRIR